MTCLEKYLQDRPGIDSIYVIQNLCPDWDECGNLIDKTDDCDKTGCPNCWNRQIPGTKSDEPHIRDSGSRTEFSTGAVRDIQKGKGRCDLMPLGVVAVLMNDGVVHALAAFKNTGDTLHLEEAVKIFAEAHQWNIPTMLLEVSKHFEEGAEKYGENNWQKGLPAKCYINSAVRHYLKWLRGDTDEHHDRAFCWNVICACWTCKHRPELNDYAPGKLGFNPDDFIGEYEEEND
jgi:hypothetical protein